MTAAGTARTLVLRKANTANEKALNKRAWE
jgi:hypothetical protein